MTKLAFYPRLAAQNIRRNGKYYLPYLASCVVSAAVFYILLYLYTNSGLGSMRGAQYVGMMLMLGAIVVAVFSVLLLFYTNSFLVKRRRRELGLYNVLGMEKRHIARFMFWETVYTALIGVIVGLALGILLSKLMLLVLCKILRESVPFGFEVSPKAALLTAGVFCAIFFLNLIRNLWQVGRSRPIDLLHGGNTGEREPKTRVVLAVFGALTLAAGYIMAITVKKPLSALVLFFFAVILVIIGTYCLFTAGSIAVLKALRNNKAYYYKTRHFISVSGMLHRMKRNAASLATICILSTMVLVTVSTTVCLYTGTDRMVDKMFPREAHFILSESDAESRSLLVSAVEKCAAETGVGATDITGVLFYQSSGGAYNLQLSEVVRQGADGSVVGENGQDYLPSLYVGFNVSDDSRAEELVSAVWQDMLDQGLRYESAFSTTRQSSSAELYSSLGGFLFIGLLLGFLFLMATALIIYYKQLSEGYEDAEGYKIMQNVGMSEKEVRDSIHSQVLAVFYLPIAAAALHVAAAFNMIARLLSLFNLSDVGRFALCCLATLAVFAVIYAVIYSVTAKAYYKIVRA